MDAQSKGVQNSFAFDIDQGMLSKLDCVGELHNIIWRCVLIDV